MSEFNYTNYPVYIESPQQHALMYGNSTGYYPPTQEYYQPVQQYVYNTPWMTNYSVTNSKETHCSNQLSPTLSPSSSITTNTTTASSSSPSSSSPSSSSPSSPPSSYHEQASLLVSSSKTTEERVKETIARANTIPAEFFQTEFLDYSQQQLAKKRKRAVIDDVKAANRRKNKKDENEEDSDEELDTNEIRRQIHIQSEQKRRAQIKDGFDELKNHLPGCANKKLSKAALLTRTVQQLEYMKKMQDELLAEVERLAKENAELKNFTSSYISTNASD
ncbi:hypothetical protein EDC96DRAFT_503113 [Choanephora cucurbitarum]|nr:hypothetical protein EDC96DRAFT_503113 [Choanephora cucurbitarum]